MRKIAHCGKVITEKEKGMVVTKRNETGIKSIFDDGNNAGINLIRTKTASTYSEFMGSRNNETTETINEAKVRMQKNLERLLNYDRYNNENMSVVDEVETTKEVVKETKTEVNSVNPLTDVDIKPSSTTLQFGDGSFQNVAKDLSRQKNEAKTSYKLSSKGKLLIVLYSLAVTVILALIMLNTGMLANLKNSKMANVENLNKVVEEYNVAVDEKVAFSADENVINIAISEYGFGY